MTGKIGGGLDIAKAEGQLQFLFLGALMPRAKTPGRSSANSPNPKLRKQCWRQNLCPRVRPQEWRRRKQLGVAASSTTSTMSAGQRDHAADREILPKAPKSSEKRLLREISRAHPLDADDARSRANRRLEHTLRGRETWTASWSRARWCAFEKNQDREASSVKSA